MRDPRNWARPAAALVAGGAAGTALVLLRARRARAASRHRSAARACRASIALRRRARRCATSPRDAQAARRALSLRERRSRRSPPWADAGPYGPPARLFPHMATCYRHPSRETGVSCSNCGRPICPDCMTTTPVGMRCPECSKQAHEGDAHARHGDGAARHLRADRDQRRRLPHRAGPVHAVRREHPRHGHQRRRALPRGDRRRPPVLAPRLASAFLHENLLHIGFNMYLLYLLGHDARAGDRLASGSRPSTSRRCSPAPSARCSRPPRPASAPPGRSSG